jgi:23S rRNA pseudouridine1911/1915/1917 synthase
MRKRVYTRWSNDPEQLTQILPPRLEVDEAEVVRLIEAGCIYVNGKRASTNLQLAVGDKVTVFHQPGEELPRLKTVHQDPWFVVVDKPTGLPSQAERSQSAHALDAQVQKRFGNEVRLIHRLDKEASGLVLFARKPDARMPLQEALAAGEIERRYMAIVDGELRGDGHIRLRIGRHGLDTRLRAALPENAPAGDPAHTVYRVLGHGVLNGRPITAVELELETGRTHQLRVHLSALGHPIVGDAAYGGPAFERLCLHAYTLELPHPLDRSRVRLHSPLPRELKQLVPGLTSPFT